MKFRTLFTITFLAVLWAFLRPQSVLAITECCCRYENGINSGTCETIDHAIDETCASYKGNANWKTSDNANLCSTAKTEPDGSASGDVQVQFKPGVTIPTPGGEFTSGTAVTVTGRTLGEYLSTVYVWFSGIVGILAAVMLLWGGFRWLTAAGNESRVESAKETIYSAIIAVILVLTAYTLLNTINPELVKIRDLTSIIAPISPIVQESELYETAPRYSEALEGDTKATTTKDTYNAAACPTAEEMKNGFTVFLTGYYMPDPAEYAGNARGFQCAAGLNCDCPKDKVEPSATCRNSQGKTWKACQWNDADIAAKKYCNRTRSNVTPIGLLSSSSGPFTAAGGQCFGRGTEFVLEPLDGSKNASSKVYASTWSVQDEGSDIKQRHLDLFMGYGRPARQTAFGLKNLAKMKITKLCTSSTVGGVKNSKAPEAIPTCETIAAQ